MARDPPRSRAPHHAPLLPVITGWPYPYILETLRARESCANSREFLLCEHVFVRYTFTLTAHDADKPWLVRNCEHRTADLSDGVGVL